VIYYRLQATVLGKTKLLLIRMLGFPWAFYEAPASVKREVLELGHILKRYYWNWVIPGMRLPS
jgi:hypothetical protein